MDLFFSLNGRIGRGQFWVGMLCLFVVSLVLSVLGLFILGDSPLLTLIVLLITLWPSICVAGKRFHDRDKSAWWYLISLVPLIGAIWIIVECGFLVGTRGDNRFGPNPVSND